MPGPLLGLAYIEITPLPSSVIYKLVNISRLSTDLVSVGLLLSRDYSNGRKYSSLSQAAFYFVCVSSKVWIHCQG